MGFLLWFGECNSVCVGGGDMSVYMVATRNIHRGSYDLYKEHSFFKVF